MYDGEAPSAGIVTGIGSVAGQEVMIVANDATVKGGTYFPMTVKKHLRAQEIARQNNLPCVYLVDSGGAFLPLQDEVFPDKDDFGRIFFNEATMSAMGIPQISAVMGSCTAGGAYVPAMSDEAVIVRGTGTIFLGGPPLVKAATGEEVSAEDLGGALVHSQTSGVTDYLAEDDADALAITRRIVGNLHRRKDDSLGRSPSPRNPLYPIDGNLRGDPVRSCVRHLMCARLSLGSWTAAVSTNSRRCTARRWSPGSPGSWATPWESSPTTAYCSLRVPSRARISSNSVRNAGSRSSSCRTSPASWSAASTRIVASQKTGRRWSWLSPMRAVPKFTVIIGGSFGAGNYAMCGRAYEPRQLWMWPNARISVMGGQQAANVLLTVRLDGLSARGQTMTQRGAGRVQTAHRRQVRTRRKPVLQYCSPVGRRDHRSSGHSHGPGSRHFGGPQRANPEDGLRRVPDVTL